MALAAIAVVIFGYNFMKGQNIFDSSREFYAVYNSVDGLSNSANVTINGLKVGSVSDISFLDSNGKILVTFKVKSDFKFSKNSEVLIYSDGFIGGKAIKILPDYAGPQAKTGDTLQSKVEQEILESLTERLAPLEVKLESAIGGIDSLVQSLNEVLDEEGKKNLKGSIAGLNTTMAHLSKVSGEIDQLLSNNSDKLNGTIANLDHTAQNFSKLSDSLAQIEVRPLVAKLDSVLEDFNTISAKLNNGEGTLGKLLNDEGIYNNLDHASKQMEELLQDIKLNPRRYINLKFSLFGGKNKTEPYQRPENPLDE